MGMDGWTIEWMIDWWLNDWLNEWLIEWLNDWLIEWLNDWLMDGWWESIQFKRIPIFYHSNTQTFISQTSNFLNFRVSIFPIFHKLFLAFLSLFHLFFTSILNIIVYRCSLLFCSGYELTANRFNKIYSSEQG